MLSNTSILQMIQKYNIKNYKNVEDLKPTHLTHHIWNIFLNNKEEEK